VKWEGHRLGIIQLLIKGAALQELQGGREEKRTLKERGYRAPRYWGGGASGGGGISAKELLVIPAIHQRNSLPDLGEDLRKCRVARVSIIWQGSTSGEELAGGGYRKEVPSRKLDPRLWLEK